MQVNLGGTWTWVHPSGGKRYEYPTKDRAQYMLEICYPDQIREQKLGGPITVRVQGISDEADEVV